LLNERLIFAVTGIPVEFTLDPTDLFGLLSLWPAWILWERHKQKHPTWRAYVALSIGTIAVIATSGREWTVTSVTDLVFSNDILYAADRESFNSDVYPVAQSLDGGQTWELAGDNTQTISAGEKSYPILACHHLYQSGETCYRVTSSHRFEYSHENNVTWLEVFLSKSLSVKAYDILRIEWNGKQYLIVAIGESGILRRELPNGDWEIIKVLNAGSY
jgi:hypothetical protein